MIRRIGGRRWQTLHKGVYMIGVIALLHFMLQAKLDVTQPVMMVGLFMMLMGWRTLPTRGMGASAAALVALAVASSIGTALVEATWYHVQNHLTLTDVLQANLSVEDGLRPAAWVLLVGFGVAALRTGRVLLNAEGKLAPHLRKMIGLYLGTSEKRADIA